MNVNQKVYEYDQVFKIGPSALGHGFVSAVDCTNWVANKYFKTFKDGFSDDPDDVQIYNGGRFIFGKIYTFLHIKDGKQERKIILSVSNTIKPADKFYEIGFDLMALRAEERTRLFKGLISTFWTIIDANMEARKKKSPLQQSIAFYDEGTRERFFEMLKIKPSFKYFNRLDVLRNTVKCIEYDDWKYLIHCIL